MRLLSRLILPALLVAAGWYGGARWGAPDFVFSAVDSAISKVMSLTGRDGGSDAPNGESVSSEISQDLSAPAASQTEATPPPGKQPQRVASYSESDLVLCKMTVSNAPPADADGRIAGIEPLANLNGVSLLLKPATNACLSSGYGHRGYSPHRGVDYFSDSGGDVLASADGVIREATYRDDYGNMIVIDHGSGVFTRYAHLASFSSAVREGVGVKRGQRLGPIGQTGRTSAPHLHFEIRTGDYNNQAGAFGLEPVDPFSL